MTHRQRNPFGDIPLPSFPGPEAHGRRGIENKPGRQALLRNVNPDVRLVGSGSDLPFDPADVIAGLVWTYGGQLAPETMRIGPLLTGEEALDLASYFDFERPQDCLGYRTGTWTV